MMAREAGPVAAPMAAPHTRKAMSAVAVGDSAVSPAKTMAPARLNR